MKRKGIFWVVLTFACYLANGQAARPSTAKPPVAKPAQPTILPDSVKIPKFSVRFGPYNGNIPTLLDDMKKLVNTELIVTDQQGQRWNTLAFRFGWNRREPSDDIKTGRRKTISVYDAVEVDSSAKIPEAWQKALVETLQSGEDLIFEKIIVEHPASKRKMVAPGLHLKIK